MRPDRGLSVASGKKRRPVVGVVEQIPTLEPRRGAVELPTGRGVP